MSVEKLRLQQRRDCSGSKLLRERAVSCRRLATAVGDPEFSRTLNSIAEEYEARATEADGMTHDDARK